MSDNIESPTQFERLNEQVPYGHIVQLLTDYDESLMGGGEMEAYY